MLFKIIGTGLVIITSTSLGLLMSNTLLQRLKDLRVLISCLQTLEREMVFMSNSLPDALLTSSKDGGSVSEIFKGCSDILKSRRGYCTTEAWEKSIEEHAKKTALNSDDLIILGYLGNNLGLYDSHCQAEKIKSILLKLQSQEKDAEDKLQKYSKVYRNLGILGGIALVIVLI